MPGVTGSISLHADLRLSGASVGASPSVHSAALDFLMSFDAGNAALGKADVLYHAMGHTLASATDTLDMTGTLKDPLGGNIANAEICAIIAKAATTNVNNLLIGPAAANGFLGPWNAAADRTKVEPGNLFMVTSINGWAVTPATGDILALINGAGGTAIDYELLIVGRTVVG
jgi:hypothetical protein